jgi:hypothetical protein
MGRRENFWEREALAGEECQGDAVTGSENGYV